MYFGLIEMAQILSLSLRRRIFPGCAVNRLDGKFAYFLESVCVCVFVCACVRACGRVFLRVCVFLCVSVRVCVGVSRARDMRIRLN